MPAGVSWSRYLAFSAAAMFSMALGSQTMVAFYRPMDDFDQVVVKIRAAKLTRTKNDAVTSNSSDIGELSSSNNPAKSDCVLQKTLPVVDSSKNTSESWKNAKNIVTVNDFISFHNRL